MLKSMRRNMKAIMWVLLVTFVLWGGSSAVLSRSKTTNYAGILSGKKIGWKEYERNLSAVSNQAKLMYGEKFNQIEQYLNLQQEAWNRIVLLKEAAKKYIRVADSEVIEYICKMPIFQDASGKFIPDIYKRVVEYFLRVPARTFEEQMKDSLKILKLKEQIVAGVAVSPDELKKEYGIRNEKINTDYALVESADFKTGLTADETKISRYYQAHSQEFKTPPRVNIEYIPFEYSNYPSKDKADEASSDVSYELSQEKQPSLKAIAKKFGLEVKETGFFAMDESIPGIGLSYEAAFEAFKLEPDQISHPIKTPKGRYIMKLKSKKEPYVPALDEIRQKINDAIIDEEAKDASYKKAEELLAAIKQKIDSGLAFKQACAEMVLEVKSTGLFTKAGYIPEIGNQEDFANTASSAQAGKLAGIAKIPQGAAIIFVTQKIGIDEEKFKKEKDEFRSKVLEEKRQKYFEEYFKKLKEKTAIKISRTPKNGV